MFTYILWQLIAGIVGIVALIFLLHSLGVFKSLGHFLKKTSRRVRITFGVLVFSFIVYFFAAHPYPLNFAMPPMMQSKAPGGMPASIPLTKIANFLVNPSMFEVVDNIGADPNDVPLPITRKHSDTVKFELTARELIAEVGDGVYFNYWTYNNQAPGPMLRVREGDMVEVSLTNDASSMHPHNIDLHSVTGPGGGGSLSLVEPGETKTFRWKALNPGLYVYHCATSNISTHNSHGQYGLILVEPKEGLAPVDREFYVMQGELYTMGGIGAKGLVSFDPEALLDGIPTYVTFNGILENEPRMKIDVGDSVRMYVGNGGVNQISSFHVIGEIFDTVYPEAAIGSEPHKNIQTTAVLPGGASIVEFTAEVPGNLILVDHALARMNKGAWAIMKVEGDERPEVYAQVD
jgi:nitrite reductase (NO-forming)